MLFRISHLLPQLSPSRCVERWPVTTDKIPLLPPPRLLFVQQVAVDAALSLVEGALFGDQSQDMSVIINKVYDIFKVTRTGDYENSMGERRSKRLQDLLPTVSTSGRAKAPPRKKSKK
ncbi:hypothetical protein LguiA_014376 [Lonicera macranthoides]